MPSSRRLDGPGGGSAAQARRQWLHAAAGGVLAALGLAPRPAGAQASAAAAPAAWAAEVALLRRGGVVVAFRHALAPGTFDPPQFRLAECSTQRNLDETGRAQATRLGEWFAARGLQPARVRSSPWCRCLDTARLAFGGAEPWAALGSPRGADEVTNQASLDALRRAVAEAAARPGRFEAWVTHMFVLSDLTGVGTRVGEGLILAPAAGGGVRVLGRLNPA